MTAAKPVGRPRTARMQEAFCSFAFPDTYGHECGALAVLVGVVKSRSTKNGVFFAMRCLNCAKIKGGENAGISEFLDYNPELHKNQWK